MKIRFGVAALLLCASTVSGQSADQKVQTIVGSQSFRDAKAFLDSDHDRFVKELIALTEIPAPSFKEQKRGAAYLVLPATSYWWLDHYEELAAHLRGISAATELGFCTIFELAPQRQDVPREKVG